MLKYVDLTSVYNFTVKILLFVIPVLFLTSFLAFEVFAQQATQNNCIIYDPAERLISVSCPSPIHLTDIFGKIQNQDILKKEGGSGNIWILNAAIQVEKGSTLVIDSKDTRWLKIVSDGKTAYPITVLGSLKIDSVKITSWDPMTQDYTKFEFDVLPDREHEHTGIDAVPRPYIIVEEEATGTTNITNSELAYLGYECGGGCSGISYYGNTGASVIKNNEIHHNRFGFYSVGVGNLLLENNHVHHNFMYGFDPHTGTHDMVIRNNTVHDHGAMGIICSLDCYNITIEGNKVYNSSGSGIMFSRNMHDSVARNNDVHNESKCIFLSQSHNNQVYNNTASNCESQGIYLFHNSVDNKVYNNTLVNATKGIEASDDSKNNVLSNNTIVGKIGTTTVLEEDQKDREE
jgi:mannuronan 5-epimerase